MVEITFAVARERVNGVIENLIQKNLDHTSLGYFPHRRVQTLSSLNAATVIFFCIGAALDEKFRAAFLFSASLIMLLIFLNVLLLKRYRDAETAEITKEIASIAQEYSSSLEKSQHVNDSNYRSNLRGLISSGHSQISIIAVFRDGQWQRIPSLLLVEGDIISLMAGDTTPAAVYELISDRNCENQDSDRESSVGNTSAKKIGWKRGKLLEKGTKVLLRAERKKYSPQNDSTPTEHEEADICNSHDIAEENVTPTDSETVPMLPQVNLKRPSKQDVSEKHKQSRAINSQSVELLTLSGDMRCFLLAETPILEYCEDIFRCVSAPSAPRESFVRSLFLYVLDEGLRLMVGVLLLFAFAVIIRMSIIAEANKTQISTILLSPLGLILLSFSPISLVLGLLCAEALTTANLLATAEALLSPDESDDDSTDASTTSRTSNFKGISFLTKRLGDLFQAIQGTTHSPDSHERIRPRRDDEASSESSSDSSSKQDEYQDEDIDDRAVKIADQASLSIPWGRQWTYTLRVLSSRLQLPKCFSKWCGLVSPSRLPTPLARSRLVEVLGAVTMVCFVDDDIVCEGYSVSEEVYLLNHTEKTSTNPEASSSLSSPLLLIFFPQKASGIMLDLHASPQLTGTRFENPDWRKHLPSLKPIGLASMLTYACVGEDSGSADLIKIPHSGFASPQPEPIPLEHTSSLQRRVSAETELVRHVKLIPPMECLRELAEEIGFVEEDADRYSRLLGLTVVAPRLGDVHLMEDTHAWGQELTRRRGNLDPHITAVVVEEKRKGGLQLMSNGHPPLLLSYCREYWDGTNISPLTAEDRNQLLTVYERWDLEDFDVVAFGYTPVPVTVKSRILSKNERSINRTASKAEWTRNTTSLHGAATDKLKRGGAKTLYFVDSCTERQLDGGHRRHGSTGSAGNSGTTESKERHSYSNHISLQKQQVQQQQQETPDMIMQGVGGTEHLSLAGGSLTAIDEEVSHSDRRNRELLVPKPSRLFSAPSSDSPQLLVSPRDDYSVNEESLGGETSQILPDDSQQTEFGLEIHSEPNRSPLLIRDSDTNSDGGDSVRSSTEAAISKDSLRNPKLRRVGSLRSKIGSSLSQQITAKQRTLIHGRGLDLGPGIGHQRSTSDPSFSFNQSPLESSHSDRQLQSQEQSAGGASRRSFQGFISPADSLDPHGYPLGSYSQSSRGFQYSDTIDSNDFILSPDLRSLQSGGGGGEGSDCSSSSPFMKKSLSLDFGLNKLTAPSPTLPTAADHTDSPPDSAQATSVAHLTPLHGITSKSLAAERELPSKRRIDSLNRKASSLGINSKSLSETTWSILRQQVFLGMTASSVPIRRVIPTLVEDLTQAGIRFVYFSPRNMRRSKKLAEKIGLQTDWNCAISLRPLDSPDTHDPHRFISSYADWDVKARLPHGIEAIRQHLKEVDNVPLLVSLFTDSTPSTTESMIDIFRENGEVVLSIGSAYRSYNQSIYQASDMGIAINMLPGDTQDLSSSSSDVLAAFPPFSSTSLCRPDLILMFRLVGLHTSHLLQTPVAGCATDPQLEGGTESESSHKINEGYENIDEDFEDDPLMPPRNGCCDRYVPSIDVLNCTGCFRQPAEASVPESEKQSSKSQTPLNLKGLLEAIRKGRVFLLNAFQIIAFVTLSCLSLSLWSVVSEVCDPDVCASSASVATRTALSLRATPSDLALHALYAFLQRGARHATDSSQKQTHPVNLLFFTLPNVLRLLILSHLISRPKDESRFRWYLAARVGWVVASVFIVGWMTSASRPLESGHFSGATTDRWIDRMASVRDVLQSGEFQSQSLAQFWHVQDVMSAQFFISIITQSATLLHRGQTVTQMSSPNSHPEYYLAILLSLSLQIGFLYIRASNRVHGMELYAEMDSEVWIAMGICPLVGLTVGYVVNSDDNFNYQRHLQFLRLEFDTRLGMHSPR